MDRNVIYNLVTNPNTHPATLRSALQRLAEEHHIVRISADFCLMRAYEELIKELEESNVVCAMGDVPARSKEDSKVLYFPKTLDLQEFYADVGLEEEKTNKTLWYNALNRKKHAKELFTELIEHCKAYVVS